LYSNKKTFVSASVGNFAGHCELKVARIGALMRGKPL
jgi:hypothetical protein